MRNQRGVKVKPYSVERGGNEKNAMGFRVRRGMEKKDERRKLNNAVVS